MPKSCAVRGASLHPFDDSLKGRDMTPIEFRKTKTAPRRWTSDEKAEFDRLLDAGKEAAEIADVLNRTRQAIYARLQRLYRKGARQARRIELGLREKGK